MFVGSFGGSPSFELEGVGCASFEVHALPRSQSRQSACFEGPKDSRLYLDPIFQDWIWDC